MTSFDRFERSLPSLFDELAAARIPDYTDDLLAQTAATRQRPGWTFTERWLPMSVISRRFAAVPRIPWRLGALVALLAVAALVAAIVAGALNNRVPAPYGPAQNGRIAFPDGQGRVLVGDPATGVTTILVNGTDNSDPLFSQDGSRVVYLHHVSATTVDLVVAPVDGSRAVTLNPKPIANPNYGGWSPDGATFLIVTYGKDLVAYDTAASGEPRNLSKALKLGRVDVGLGYNFRSSQAFRPPAGTEILASVSSGARLVAVDSDGSAVRPILDRATSPVPFTRLKGAEWSPDGSRIALLLEQAPNSQRWHGYVMNADGTGLKPLGDLGANPLGDQNSLLWSPDGKHLAYQYWIHDAVGGGQQSHPIGIFDVASGSTRDVGPTATNGFSTWDWSPDGTSILEVPQDGSGDVLIVNAATGRSQTAPWSVTPADAATAGDWCHDCVSWQRTAR